MGKRGPQPTTGKGVTIGVRCQGEFLAMLDLWRSAHAVAPSRAAALRYLAEVGLRSAGIAPGKAMSRNEIVRRIAFVAQSDTPAGGRVRRVIGTPKRPRQ